MTTITATERPALPASAGRHARLAHWALNPAWMTHDMLLAGHGLRVMADGSSWGPRWLESLAYGATVIRDDLTRGRLAYESGAWDDHPSGPLAERVRERAAEAAAAHWANPEGAWAVFSDLYMWARVTEAGVTLTAEPPTEMLRWAAERILWALVSGPGPSDEALAAIHLDGPGEEW